MFPFACARRETTHDLRSSERYLVRWALLRERRYPRRIALYVYKTTMGFAHFQGFSRAEAHL